MNDCESVEDTVMGAIEEVMGKVFSEGKDSDLLGLEVSFERA
jgi:hypothetical protein